MDMKVSQAIQRIRTKTALAVPARDYLLVYTWDTITTSTPDMVDILDDFL